MQVAYVDRTSLKTQRRHLGAIALTGASSATASTTSELIVFGAAGTEPRRSMDAQTAFTQTQASR